MVLVYVGGHTALVCQHGQFTSPPASITYPPALPLATTTLFTRPACRRYLKRNYLVRGRGWSILSRTGQTLERSIYSMRIHYGFRFVNSSLHYCRPTSQDWAETSPVTATNHGSPQARRGQAGGTGRLSRPRCHPDAIRRYS